MANIVLSNGVRQNLLSLQDTTRLAEATQVRLATGRKVNSALDNPVNYFSSGQLNNRASLLSGLLDGISNGIQTITAASSGIEAITKLVQSAQATIRQAINEAAQNRPSKLGAVSLGTEGPGISQSAQDVALNKLLEGTTATAATSSTPGNLGIGANSTVTISPLPTSRR
jgi:flagellin